MEGVSISRWGRRFAGVLLIVSAVARPASADRGPSRADFERAVLAEAATRTDPTACERPGAEPGPARAIPRADRARVLGRILALGDRRAAVVRVATARTDANDDLAHRLFVVVLAPRGGGWRPDARAEIPLGDAPFDYGDEPALRIARLEDVDDDGE
ncbi:MAG TPA: hypothetical protein RMH99_16210 [Sandaracinaceae bacterium LLY-WYZ-13_1]|nr:hypothetical protein [Sandaracinaceae bacterium LLY-WYZ-13_1]